MLRRPGEVVVMQTFQRHQKQSQNKSAKSNSEGPAPALRLTLMLPPPVPRNPPIPEPQVLNKPQQIQIDCKQFETDEMNNWKEECVPMYGFMTDLALKK